MPPLVRHTELAEHPGRRAIARVTGRVDPVESQFPEPARQKLLPDRRAHAATPDPRVHDVGDFALALQTATDVQLPHADEFVLEASDVGESPSPTATARPTSTTSTGRSPTCGGPPPRRACRPPFSLSAPPWNAPGPTWHSPPPAAAAPTSGLRPEGGRVRPSAATGRKIHDLAECEAQHDLPMRRPHPPPRMPAGAQHQDAAGPARRGHPRPVKRPVFADSVSAALSAPNPSLESRAPQAHHRPAPASALVGAVDRVVGVPEPGGLSVPVSLTGCDRGTRQRGNEMILKP